ncbi:MAG: methyl-accepting chemotaxis protein [Ktedonobacteraceae bacterium]|nr:methyl-accepting chemotaxis protein [Ktedonobacteraceae bacterium]
MFDTRAKGGVSFPGQSLNPSASGAAPEPSANGSTQEEGLAEKLIRYYPWSIPVVVLVHALYLGFLHLRPDIRSTNAGRVVDDSFILLGEIIILIACGYALSRIQQLKHDRYKSVVRRATFAVLFLAASALSNSIGQVFWIWYDATLNAVPYPAIDDAFFLANYPFFFIGIALLIPRGGSFAGRARVLVDAGTLVLSVLAIFWYFVLGPTLAALSGSALVKTVSLAYPLSDLAASVAAILLYFNPFTETAPQRTLVRLTLGVACSAISNMIYGYLQASGVYYTAMFIDVGFPLTWMLIAWAIFSYPADVARMVEERLERARHAPSRPHLSSRISAIFRTILPLFFTLLTCILLLLAVAMRGGAPLEQVILVCAGLFLLPVVRQSLTLTDNMMLNERLRVALDQSQQAFQQSQNELVSTTLRAEHLEQLLASIRDLQQVHARLAHGDLQARAVVQGPLAPVAQSLNLLIERMNRWLQAGQTNQTLTREAEQLCYALEQLSEGKIAQNISPQHSPLPTGNALLLTGRLQMRLSMHFQRQRETLRLARKRVETMKDVIKQVRSNMQKEAKDYSKEEQVLSIIERGLANYELLLQELWNSSNIYMQQQSTVHSTTRLPE